MLQQKGQRIVGQQAAHNFFFLHGAVASQRQRRASGETLGLDETFSLLLAELSRQENFDLAAIELHYVGEALSLVYAAKFTLLDVPRRQWGVLVDGDDGITAVMMTAPADNFAEVSLDFAALVASLHYAAPKAPAPHPAAPN